MSLVSRGFGALQRIITRGFFSSTDVGIGFLTGETSVDLAYDNTTSVINALDGKSNSFNSLNVETKINDSITK